MAVYTKLTKEEISRHLTNYSLGDLIEFKEIIEGIDNSNFILVTSSSGGAKRTSNEGDEIGVSNTSSADDMILAKYILTIFESRINKNDLPFFINFKLHLAQKGISCPRPILDNQGAMIVDLIGKKSSIVTFLEGANLKTRADGYYDNITPQHCFEAGAMLGKMHIAAQDFALKRENDLGAKGLRPLFSKFEDLTKNFTYADFLSNNDFVKQNIHAEIIAALEFLEKSWRLDLPSAAAHLDFFPDNLFFDKNNKASGVIDFYFAANDALIYDFAIAVNAWCFDENNNFSQEKFLALKNGYENFRKFSVAELDFLKIALCGAAMRFLLTRLHDMFFTSKNSLVKIKNPQEYLAKLRFFLSEFK